MNYIIKRNGLNFCIDYYVELLGVLCILCEDQDAIYGAGEASCNDAYILEVKEYFDKCQAAKLTEMLELFSKKYWFNYDAPVQLMLMLSNNQPIDKDVLFRERKIIPDELLNQFLDELKGFEAESGFAGFYAKHLSMYETIIDRFIRDYEKYNSHQYLWSFLDVSPKCDYYVNLMLGITNANYGATMGNKVYCCICPYFETRYTPMPDYSHNPIYFTTLVLHEFAHSFVNSSVAALRNSIETIDVTQYLQTLDENGYGESVETLINETIIRALECLYVKEYFTEWYEAYTAEYVAEGYTKIREVIELLHSSMDYERIIQLF